MKIQLMSDLHFEFGWEHYPVPIDPETVLVLAGDIDSRPHKVREFVLNAAEEFKHVIFVAGNHEFYGNDLPETLKYFKKFALNKENIHFLENDFVKIDDVTFLGGTLWSEPEWGVFRQINDASLITYNGEVFTDTHVKELCRETRQFIIEALDKIPGKKVVVTHFGPDQVLMNPKWKNYPNLNTYFWASGFQDHFYKADMWLFGHTHDFTFQNIDGCLCVCNPHGYIRYGRKENPNYNFDMILEI